MAVIIIHVTLLKHLGRFSECRHYAREQLAHLERAKQPLLTIEARASVARILADVQFLSGDSTALDSTLSYYASAADEMAVPLIRMHAAVLRRLAADVPSPVEDRLLLDHLKQQLHDVQFTARPTGELLFLVFDALRLALRCGYTAQIPLLLDAARIRMTDLAPDEPELLSLISAYSAVVAGPAPADLGERLVRRIEVAEQHQAVHLEAWLRVLPAIHEQRSGRYSEARRVLRRGLHLIEQSGAIRIAADLPELQPILAAVNTAFARTLLGRLQPTPTADEFSIHEKQIISGLLRGLASAAIAAEIGLTPATVHYHLTKIYRKLAVSRRADALERLRERFPAVA
jgi:DNA-binding CsgD family transcriptional regulator